MHHQADAEAVLADLQSEVDVHILVEARLAFGREQHGVEPFGIFGGEDIVVEPFDVEHPPDERLGAGGEVQIAAAEGAQAGQQQDHPFGDLRIVELGDVAQRRQVGVGADPGEIDVRAFEPGCGVGDQSSPLFFPAAGTLFIILILFILPGDGGLLLRLGFVFRRDAGFGLADRVVDDGLNLFQDALRILLGETGDQPVQDGLCISGQIGGAEGGVELLGFRAG